MDIDDLIEKARSSQMTDSERETQRQSFAYGNSNFENENITRQTVNRESEKLRDDQG